MEEDDDLQKHAVSPMCKDKQFLDTKTNYSSERSKKKSLITF